MNATAATRRPWYREPWPWLLMLPPLLSMIGGFTMLYLALSDPPEIVGSGAAPLAAERPYDPHAPTPTEAARP